MNYEIQGFLTHVGETEQVKDTFSKRVCWLEVNDGKYPQTLQFEFTQDKCDLLDKHFAGQEVRIKFNLRGREWNGKVFNTLAAWKIEEVQATKLAPAKSTATVEAGEDLPF